MRRVGPRMPIFRWQQVGVRSCPFDAAALTLLHQAASGSARSINLLGSLATAAALRAKDTTIHSEHVQQVQAQLPWLTSSPARR